MAIPAAVAGDVPGAAAPDDPGEDIRAALSVRRASSKGAIQPSRPRSTLHTLSTIDLRGERMSGNLAAQRARH